jgi:hypothetical protein
MADGSLGPVRPGANVKKNGFSSLLTLRRHKLECFPVASFLLTDRVFTGEAKSSHFYPQMLDLAKK